MSEQDLPALNRRSRRHKPEPLPDDLYDYAVDPAPSRRPPRRKASGKWHDNLRITDDWPDRVPVTEEEVDVFERYFGDLLDRLFGEPLYTKPGENSLHSISSDDIKKSE